MLNGGIMEENLKKEQLNVLMALALMKHLYNQQKISEKTYKKILSQYANKELADVESLC